MTNGDFWYLALPGLLFGLGIVALFWGMHSLLRWVWPPIVELRPEWITEGAKRGGLNTKPKTPRPTQSIAQRPSFDDPGPKAA